MSPPRGSAHADRASQAALLEAAPPATAPDREAVAAAPETRRASAWPADRREALGLGFFLAQLLSIFGIALSYGFLTLGALTARWCARGRILARLCTPGAAVLLVPLGAYLALTSVSVALSYDPRRSLDALVDVLALAPVALAIVFVRGERRVRLVVGGLVLLGAVLAAYGFLESIFGGGGLDLDRRVRGPFSHYQTLAGVLLLCDLLVLASLAHRPSPRRYLAWGAFVLVSGALVLGLTRGAWVALAAALLLLLVLLLRSPRALAWATAAVVALLLFAPLRVVERAASIFDPYDSSNYDRLCMAWSGLLMIQERPLFGIGPDMVSELYPIYRHPTAPRLERPHLHNSFLEIAAERGVPAALAFVALLGGSALLSWRGFRREGGLAGARSDLWVGSLLGVAAFAVAALFEDSWGDTEVQRVLLFLLAMPVCLRADPEVP